MNSSKGKTSKSRSSECRQMAIYVIPALKMCLENVRGGTEGGGKRKSSDPEEEREEVEEREDDGEDPLFDASPRLCLQQIDVKDVEEESASIGASQHRWFRMSQCKEELLSSLMRWNLVIKINIMQMLK